MSTRVSRLLLLIALVIASVTMRGEMARAAVPGMTMDCHDHAGPGHGPIAPKFDCAAICTATLPDSAPTAFAAFQAAALIVPRSAEILKGHLLGVATPPPKRASGPPMQPTNFQEYL